MFSCMTVAAKNYPSNTWKRIADNCKVGFVDPEGKVMIAPQFAHASSFSEGLAFVWSYQNEKQAKKDLALGEEFHDYEIGPNSITGIIDSTGTYIVVPKINFEMRTGFRNGIATVIINHDVRIINKKGEIILPYDTKYDAEYRKILLKGIDTAIHKYVFLNAYRQQVYGPFDAVEEYSGNFAAVCLGGKWGYINRQGIIVVEPQYEHADYFKNGYASVTDKFTDGNEQHIIFKIIDTLGRVVLQSFSWAYDDYSEGMAVYVGKTMDKKGKHMFGYVDSTGKVVIEAKFERARAFHNGIAAVQVDGKMGFINKKGEWVIPPTYDFIGDFQFDTALFNDNNRTGYINREGKIIWSAIFIKDCN